MYVYLVMWQSSRARVNLQPPTSNLDILHTGVAPRRWDVGVCTLCIYVCGFIWRYSGEVAG